MTSTRYVKRRRELPEAWFKRKCDECHSTIDEGEDVVCTDCGSHDDCVHEDDCICQGNAEYMREHARDLKHSMEEARRANLHVAASRIENTLRRLYPEWPGLVVP